jgi:hypothetical protein
MGCPRNWSIRLLVSSVDRTVMNCPALSVVMMFALCAPSAAIGAVEGEAHGDLAASAVIVVVVLPEGKLTVADAPPVTGPRTVPLRSTLANRTSGPVVSAVRLSPQVV